MVFPHHATRFFRPGAPGRRPWRDRRLPFLQGVVVVMEWSMATAGPGFHRGDKQGVAGDSTSIKRQPEDTSTNCTDGKIHRSTRALVNTARNNNQFNKMEQHHVISAAGGSLQQGAWLPLHVPGLPPVVGAPFVVAARHRRAGHIRGRLRRGAEPGPTRALRRVSDCKVL